MSEEATATETTTEALATEAPATDWRSTLPDELKEAPYLKVKDKTAAEIAADLANAASWQGNSIRIPGPDATDEQRNEFLERAVEKLPGLMKTPDPLGEGTDEILAKLGKPENPSDYKSPEGVDVPPELKAQAHAAGLTQKQFETLVSQQNETAKNIELEGKAFRDEQEAVLKADWGAAVQDRLTAVADYLAQEGAPVELREAFDNQKLSADTVKWLYEQADASAESRAAADHVDGRTGALTPDEAAAQIQEVWAQINELNPGDPRRAALMARKTELTKIKLGV